MRQNPDDKYQYWASKPADELAPLIIEKAEDYYNAIKSNGILALWRRIYSAYYGLDTSGAAHEGSQITMAGEQGELLEVRVKHLKSLVQYIWITTTATRMNFQPRAVNSDYKTKAQVQVAKSLIEYYEREKHYDAIMKSTALRALLYGLSYLWLYWDYFTGKEVQPDVDAEGVPTGGVIREGDIAAKSLSPIDVIKDLTRSERDQQWYIVRARANKYDIASRFPDKPDLQDAILDIEAPNDDTCPRLFEKGFGGAGDDIAEDDIYVWHFYHKPTEAIPNGRYLVVYSSEAWGVDARLPEDDLPLYHMCPEEFLETSWGYSTAWDLITCNELYDSLVSGLFSYIDASLIPNILVPIGSEIGTEELSGGLGLIKYPPGVPPPMALQMFDTNVANATVAIANWVKGDMQLIPGISSLARGQVDANIKSGSMAALVHAQTLHFNSAYEASYVQLAEDFATGLVNLCKQHVDTPKIITIVGENDKGKLGSFTSEDLADINRVVVDVGNPMERSIAGKEAMATTLLDKGRITRPEHYFEVLRTGRLESLFRPEEAQINSIKSENEILMGGKCSIIEMDTDTEGGSQRREVVKECPVLITDNHALHIIYHAAEINEPEARTNVDLIKAPLVHIRDHMFQMQFGDKFVQAVLGYGPPAGPEEPTPPPGGPPSKPMPELQKPLNLSSASQGAQPVQMPKPAEPPMQ